MGIFSFSLKDRNLASQLEPSERPTTDEGKQLASALAKRLTEIANTPASGQEASNIVPGDPSATMYLIPPGIKLWEGPILGRRLKIHLPLWKEGEKLGPIATAWVHVHQGKLVLGPKASRGVPVASLMELLSLAFASSIEEYCRKKTRDIVKLFMGRFNDGSLVSNLRLKGGGDVPELTIAETIRIEITIYTAAGDPYARVPRTRPPPTPSHLASCAKLTKKASDKYQADVTIEIHCSCGSRSFQILYHRGGDLDEEGEPSDGPFQAEYEGEAFYVVSARCAKCKLVHLLFDSHIHGYDALVAGWPEDPGDKRPPMDTWKCRKCGKDSAHKVTVAFQMHDEDEIKEMIAEGGAKLTPDGWQDAFAWVFMKVQCEECKLVTDEFVSYECS